jgi:hypothetical protein
MPTIARNGRWIIEVMYHEEVTNYSMWADACTYYVKDAITGKIYDSYDWSQNDMGEQNGPVSVSFSEDGRAIVLKFHYGTTTYLFLPV